jgi:hypothetical protein
VIEVIDNYVILLEFVGQHSAPSKHEYLSPDNATTSIVDVVDQYKVSRYVSNL